MENYTLKECGSTTHTENKLLEICRGTTNGKEKEQTYEALQKRGGFLVPPSHSPRSNIGIDHFDRHRRYHHITQNIWLPISTGRDHTLTSPPLTLEKTFLRRKGGHRDLFHLHDVFATSTSLRRCRRQDT